MMTSHGKLRKEKGSLAEYESQMKGKHVHQHEHVLCARLSLLMHFDAARMHSHEIK